MKTDKCLHPEEHRQRIGFGIYCTDCNILVAHWKPTDDELINSIAESFEFVNS